MAEKWQHFREQLRSFWEKLPRAARIAIPCVSAVVFAALLVLPRLFAPRMVPLFTGMSPEEAAQVVDLLQEKQVRYELAAGGTAILVPADQVYELRLEVAGAGLPGDSVVGFELLNQTNLGLTDFERRARYNWALQGELTRTIEKMEGVDEARVHLVIPESSVFVREEEPPSASVFLKLKPGYSLSPVQVRAIITLVSRSVPGLKEKDVAVVDQNGRLLSAGLENPSSPASGLSTAAASERLALTRQFERETEERIRSMLEQVFGLGQAVVRVSAVLDFDLREERQEQFSPAPGSDRGLLRSEQVELETSTSSLEAGAAGVPGISSNVPGYLTVDAAASPQASGEKSLTIRNYELNRIESYYVPAPGRVNRLSVAVILNRRLEPAEQAQVEAAVASAAGIVRERGDQLTIATVPFSTTASSPQSGSEEGRQPLPTGLVLGALALALLITAGALGLLYRGKRAKELRARPSFAETLNGIAAEGSTGEEAVGVATPAAGGRGEGGPGPGRTGQALAGIDLLPGRAEAANEEDRLRQQLQEQVARLAREDPEGFLRTLRGWLVSDVTRRGRRVGGR
ncbi:MAG: flagellar M-ring protein FliF [Limnochordales bacterium]|nr:flagellar M-ring protein FliF [Limnochordales bacterium]